MTIKTKKIINEYYFYIGSLPPTVVKIALKNLYHSPVTFAVAVVIVVAAFEIISTGLAILSDN